MKRLRHIIPSVALILWATGALAQTGSDDPCAAVKVACEYYEGPRTIVTRFGVVVVGQQRDHTVGKARQVLDRWLQQDRNPMRRVIEGRPSLDTDPVSSDAPRPLVLAHDDPGGW